MRAAANLAVSDLTKEYRRRGGSVMAVDGVSFRIEPGEVVGLLGANGAGKTTILKCLCGLIRPTRGSIRIGGTDLWVGRRRAAQAQVAAVLEGNRNVYWKLTPRENIRVFAGLQGLLPSRVRAEAERLLDLFGIADKADATTESLSRGMQQKLSIVCAMIRQTPTLLLDEPTLGLDVEASQDLRSTLKEIVRAGDRSILLSSHDLDVVESVCDRVLILRDGHLILDEALTRLLGLLHASVLEAVVADKVDLRLQHLLETHFGTLRVEAIPDGARILVQRPAEERDMYDLIDLLRSNGASVVSICRRRPELEAVYLRLVQGDDPC